MIQDLLRRSRAWVGRLLTAIAVTLFAAAMLAPVLAVASMATKSTANAPPIIFIIALVVGVIAVAVAIPSIAASFSNKGHGRLQLNFRPQKTAFALPAAGMYETRWSALRRRSRSMLETTASATKNIATMMTGIASPARFAA